jgi:two-component system, chemotaxis family, protein-glutamate methylesterase/glutaminase
MPPSIELGGRTPARSPAPGAGDTGRSLRVLVVDDSALVRRTVTALLQEDPAIRVVGSAADGLEALALAERLTPDVVTLDLVMPLMDGLSCLSEMVGRLKQRVVVLSSLAQDRSYATYKALALGAIDFVAKPGGGVEGGAEAVGVELRQKVWTAASVPATRVARCRPVPRPHDRPAAASTEALPSRRSVVRHVVGIGGSTGGATALETLLRSLPPGFAAAILAVQHMPLGFSGSFARYLDSVAPIRVKEGEDGEEVLPGTAYIAPGGSHLRLQRTRSGPVLRLDHQGPEDGGYRPSINALLCSIAVAAKGQSVGVLLSGMGRDGTAGMTAVRSLGGRTIAQDERSSIVYGMAERAVATGSVDWILPLDELGGAILRATETP